MVLNTATDRLEESSGTIYTGIYNFEGEQENRLVYTLPAPGMYSIIAGVKDVAGNIAYARTLVLYDNATSMTVTQAPLMVEGAEPNGDTYWVSTIQKTGEAAPVLGFSWKDRYINKFYADNSLLNAVKPFANGIDDTSGNRTMEKTDNINGVTKFQYALETGLSKSRKRQVATEPTWQDVLPLSDSIMIDQPRGDGDAFTLHFLATDIAGNQHVDKIYIRVDSTPPHVNQEQVVFTKNTGYQGYRFYSR